MPQGDFYTFSSTVFAVAFTFVGGYVFFVGWWVPRLVLAFKARHWLAQTNLSIVRGERETTATHKPLRVPGVQNFLQSSLWCWKWFDLPEGQELEEWMDIIMPWGAGVQIIEQRIIGRGLVPMYPGYKGWIATVKLPDEPSYWPENLLLCVLFVALLYVLVSSSPLSASKVELSRLEVTSVNLPSTVWVQPTATLLLLWAAQREDIFSRVYSQINSWTVTLVSNLIVALPTFNAGTTLQRLKIVQPVSPLVDNVRSL
jgi:hypothetical protein